MRDHKVRCRKVPRGELLSFLCGVGMPSHAPDTSVSSETRKLCWALVWVLLRCHYIELNFQAPLPPSSPILRLLCQHQLWYGLRGSWITVTLITWEISKIRGPSSQELGTKANQMCYSTTDNTWKCLVKNTVLCKEGWPNQTRKGVSPNPWSWIALKLLWF